MPGAERAEVYFIVAMMVLILIVSFAAVYFFFKQYRKEMRDKELRRTDESARAPQFVGETRQCSSLSLEEQEPHEFVVAGDREVMATPMSESRSVLVSAQ
jgi:hypothetical protein